MSSDGAPSENRPPAAGVPRTERREVERVQGARPGDVSVHIRRPKFVGFTRRGRGRLEALLELEQPRSPLGNLWRFLVGAPLHSEMERHERLSKKKALAVISSGALAWVAYTPQETLIVLLAAVTAAVVWSLPISMAVVVLLAIVVTSYRQTIYAYPSGGGSYIVALANLGETPGLVAVSALIVGYILPVSEATGVFLGS